MIRRATVRDAPTLHAMLQALSDHDGGDYQVGSVETLLQHGFGANPLFHALIAETDHPVGMTIYYPDYSTHRGEPGVYVQDIYVEPAARGTGIARQLLAATMIHQTWAACYVTLGVSPANTVACRFYDRMGFRNRGYDFLILD
ncbi:MAG: GNAT family N-acetyltransferase, partial [Paracoccaceae bacterium]